MVSILGSTTATQLQSQMDSTADLSDEQKKKIKEIIAKYEAKEITQTEEQNEIAKVKASAAKANKAAKKNNTDALSQTKEANEMSSKDSLPKIQEDLSKKLTDLLNNKKSGNVNQEDLDKFIDNLKTTLESDQGAIVDQTA
ncbi:MAG: hypothetical protein Q8903_11225 [Bacteroidota bacterium]|nr:hypothetical protein [Bacteroidota bacterium]